MYNVYKQICWIVFTLMLFTACNSYKENKKHLMNSTMNDTVLLKVNQTYDVTLSSRGSSGLQLMYRTTNDSMVEINRIGTGDLNNKDVGGAAKVNYQIKALQPGNVTVTFYETRPWDKNFKEIVQKQINIVIQGS